MPEVPYGYPLRYMYDPPTHMKVAEDDMLCNGDHIFVGLRAYASTRKQRLGHRPSLRRHIWEWSRPVSYMGPSIFVKVAQEQQLKKKTAQVENEYRERCREVKIAKKAEAWSARANQQIRQRESANTLPR